MTPTAWDPCEILNAHSILYTHWYEWALRYHGSSTVCFHRYLLIKTPHDAETCLRAVGWSPFAHQYYEPSSVD